MAEQTGSEEVTLEDAVAKRRRRSSSSRYALW